MQGLWLPIDLRQLEGSHLGDPEATAAAHENRARSLGWVSGAKSRRMDHRPSPAVVMRTFHTRLHLTTGDLSEEPRDLGKKQAQIEGITRESMRRALPTLPVRSQSGDGGLADVVQG
jgi:hypothetical protein